MKNTKQAPPIVDAKTLYIARLTTLQAKLNSLQNYAAAARSRDANPYADIHWANAGDIGHVLDVLDEAMEFLQLK